MIHGRLKMAIKYYGIRVGIKKRQEKCLVASWKLKVKERDDCKVGK
jgi:hypothetical protein